MIDGVELQKVSFGQNPPKIDRIWAEKDNLGDDFNGAQVNDCLLKSYLMLWDLLVCSRFKPMLSYFTLKFF